MELGQTHYRFTNIYGAEPVKLILLVKILKDYILLTASEAQQLVDEVYNTWKIIVIRGRR